MRQELHDERRDRLLLAARTTFLSQGYERTRIAAISKAARVANSTLYTYFENKLELFKAVVAGAMQPYQGMFSDPDFDAEDPEEMLLVWTTAYFRFQSDPAVRALYRLITAEQPAHPELGEHIYAECRDLIGAPLRRGLARYVADGRQTIPSPAMASRLLEGMVEHSTLTIAMFQGDEASPLHDAGELCREIVRVFLAAYRPEVEILPLET